MTFKEASLIMLKTDDSMDHQWNATTTGKTLPFFLNGQELNYKRRYGT